MKRLIIILMATLVLLTGCEDTNLYLATEAGKDAVRAVTLNDETVKKLARMASEKSDSRHRIASAQNTYGRRLSRLLANLPASALEGYDIRVYLSPSINAFAMADGTIRIHSSLMDIMTDDELLFVLGHEMGHVTENHIRNKIRLAYAASAVRKTIASQENMAGDIARSALGGFLETLLNAQYSQAEEKESDDTGLAFLNRLGKDPGAAVTALEKLAAKGGGHSFLSSHPAPGQRADRMAQQIASPETASDSTGDSSGAEFFLTRIMAFWKVVRQWIN